MPPLPNRQFRLVSRPVGLPKPTDFDLVTAPAPEPGEGEVLVKVLYVSLDPAMRGWMNEGKSYVPPVPLGDVMRAGGLGRVLASNDPLLSPGDVVTGPTGVQELAVSRGRSWTRVDPAAAPLPRFLGALGLPGMTAYFGLLDVCRPKQGETVVVSGAAGAVGSVAGQIAKLHGCRTIGIAGGPEKCRYLVEELGFDAAVDYKREIVFKSLRQHAPDGIDVYFDNVGGEVLDVALAQLARKGRVAICGAISQYNSVEGVKGPKNYLSLLVNRARMEGFVVFDYAPRYPEATAAISRWLAEGRLKAREDVVKGLETFPQTLLRLFTGENFGKLVLQVGD